MNLASHTNPKASDLLRAQYLRRRERNPLYSTRAFARDLGMSQGFISLVLNGKRKLSMKSALELSANLAMTRQETRAFLDAVALELQGGARARTEPFAQLELDGFKLISQWYHIAILDLMLVEGAKADGAWIAKRLGLTRIQAKDAVERLKRLGLLKEQGGRWIKTKAKLEVPTRRSDTAIRAFHRQMISKALEELSKSDQKNFDAREISAITLPLDPKRMVEVKRHIDQFQKEMIEIFGAGRCSELYQLNVQFFPLTRAIDEKKGKKK